MAENLCEKVTTHRAELGEGPAWDDLRNLIYWVDILRGEINCYSPQTGKMDTCKINQPVGAIALTLTGNLIGAVKSGFAHIDFAGGQVDIIDQPEADLPKNRFNDGKCDPAGRFWAGSMNLDEKSPTGNLYTLGKDLNVSLKIPHVTISNGMAWNSRHDTFYYIDSPKLTVQAYDYDIHSGTLANPRPAIKFDKYQGYPDGMTIDSEDMLWIAFFDGWQVSRWDPHIGKCLRQIRMPVSRPTSCTFGGADFGDLYITTASIGLQPDELSEQPLAGQLLVIKNLGYCGIPGDRFFG